MKRMNGKNQYICHFCGRACIKPADDSCPKEFGKFSRWQVCWNCKVSYAVGPKVNLKGIKLWQYDPRKPRNFYQVFVNYKTNKTEINYMEEKTLSPDNRTYMSFKRLIEFEHPVRFTPDNLLDKIKTYLLFS